jgi:hypothetical protein
MLLSKDTLKDIKKKSTVINVYGVDVKLCSMSLSQQLQIEENSKQDKNLFVSQILMNCCVDENDKPVFTSREDVESLPADFTLIVFKECLALNGLGDKDVEKMAKNS